MGFASIGRTALVLGAGIAAGVGAAITNAVHAGEDLILGDRAERRRKARRQSGKTRYRAHGYGRSRYMPHQGEREQTRRIRQLLNGQLRCWEPPAPEITVEGKLWEPPATAPAAAVPAKALIENGLDAERRAKNRERALKAARTRAAKRAAELETAANG